MRRSTAEPGIIDPRDPALPVEVADKIELWGHYSDATINLHDRLYGIREGQVEPGLRIEG